MNRPGFTFCICPDSALARQYIDSMADKFPPSGNEEGGMLAPLPKNWKKEVFWADEGLEDSFWQALAVQDLFKGSRLIIIRNAQQILTDTWKKLGSALARANPSIWVFICLEVNFEQGQPKIPASVKKLKAFSFAAEQGWVWANAGLSGKGMLDYIKTKAAGLNLVIPSTLLAELRNRLPPDAAAIGLELEKISLLMEPGQNELRPEHLEQIGQQAEVDVFGVLRSLQAGTRPEKIWATVLASESGNAKDKMLFAFLGALVREARILWQLLFGEKVFVPGNLAGEKLAFARQLGIRRLSELWELALEAEQGIKSGEVSEEQALERLIADLFSLFAKK